MDARKLLEIVKSVDPSSVDLYTFAAQIAEAQKEADARIAESMDCPEVAAAIRT